MEGRSLSQPDRAKDDQQELDLLTKRIGKKKFCLRETLLSGMSSRIVKRSAILTFSIPKATPSRLSRSPDRLAVPRRPGLVGYSFFASSTSRSAFVSPKCRHRTVPEESSRNSAIPEMSRLSSPPLGTNRS